MALNRKLTPILAGRTIQVVSPSEEAVDITFSDGSVAHVKIAKPVSADPLLNRTVKKVRQRGDLMDLDFEDGSFAEIKLAEATSSVMLRDRDNKLEYAD
jgi:hypothetical protein